MKLNIAEFVLLTSLLYDLAASTLELSHESAAKQETEQLSVLCKETDNGDGTSWWGPKHKKLGEKTNPMARTKTFGLQLLFHKIKKEDAGTYTCKTKFESANFTLFVGQPFMFVNTPLEQEGQEGTNVLVKCESTGTYVNWLIDNQAPQEEGIDNASFDLLDDETIAKLFPKAGPRLLFKKKYNEYKTEKEPKVLAEVSTNFASPSYTTSSDTVTNEDCIEIDLTDVWTNESQNLNDDNILNATLKENFEEADLNSTPKRRRTIEIVNIFDGSLESVLSNTIDGKIVLLRKGNLNNDARQRLVKEIINYLIGKLGVEGVKTFMLEYAAEEIAKLFPNEVAETYYIPYLPKSPSVFKKAAKGKLWSRFVNVRSAIKTAENSLKKEKVTLAIKEYPNKDAEIDLLCTIIEPKDKVVALWRETYEQRKLVLRSSSLTVQEVFDRYAALSTSIGPELIDSDFNTKYGDNDLVYQTLPEVAKAIVSEAKNRKISVVSEENIEPKYKVMGDGLLVVNATKEDARHYTCKAVSEKLGEMDDITIYLKITPNTYSLTQLEHTTLYEVRAATENPADLSDFTDTSLFETEPNAASTFKNNSHTTFVASFAFSILIIFLNGLFESK